jgi:hypothetical protein
MKVKEKVSVRFGKSGWNCLRPAIGVGLVLVLISAHAGPAHAAPKSGGVFWVSTSADNIDGWNMSLREAILLVDGGTGPTGLNRGLTDAEETHLGGSCGYDIGGDLIGCGPGYANTIYFQNSLGTNPVIVLGSPLRGLANNTTLDGGYGSIYPIIDASAIGANYDGLVVGGNDTVSGITVKGAPRWDFNVYGDSNTLTNVNAWKAGQDGLSIRGNYNTASGVLVGVQSSDSTDCSSGNTDNGIAISGGVTGNSVQNSTINCNGQNGLSITDGGWTKVNGNTLRLNSFDGIYVTGHSQNNQIGGPTFLSTLPGNQVGANNRNGIEIVGSQARNNLIAGDKVGTSASGAASDPNALSGIVVDGANYNYIGDPVAAVNTVSGNALSGIVLSDGAGFNSVAHDRIGLAAQSNAKVPNGLYGLYLNSGAHDNTVSGDDFDWSGLTGVLIENSTTASNTLTSDNVDGNGSGGVAIRDGAFNNVIGTPTSPDNIDSNTGNGVAISGGAHGNRVEANPISSSSLNGVWLSDNGTTGNVISGTLLTYNGADGIYESSGAAGNVWSHLVTAANGHMGLEVAPPSADIPTITTTLITSHGVTLTGRVDNSWYFTTVGVEAYEVYVNSHGFPEIVYWGNAQANFSGYWSMSNSGGRRPEESSCFVAFETSTTVLFGVYVDSSSLSPNPCRAILPRVSR